MGKGDPRLTARKRAKLRAGANAPTKLGKRTDEGRLSRAANARPKEPQEPAPVVVKRRQCLRLDEADAARQEAGSGHGLLYLAGVLSWEGYEIAERYRKLRHAYRVVTLRADTVDGVTFRGPPIDARSAALPVSPDGHPGGDTPRWAAVETREEREERIRHDWLQVEATLACREPLVLALNAATVRDEDLRRRPREACRVIDALKVLAELWRMEPRDVVPRDRAA